MKVISSSSRWRGNLDSDGWIYAETIPENESSLVLPRRGFIPAAFVEINLYPEPISLTSPRRQEVGEATPTHRRNHTNHKSENAFLALGQATEL